MAKPNTIVREDAWGPYVRAGGYLFRPDGADIGHRYEDVHVMHVRGVPHVFAPSGTGIPAGTAVRASHRGGTQLGLVGDEVWFSHGTYFGDDGSYIDSELIHRVCTDSGTFGSSEMHVRNRAELTAKASD